MGVRLCLHVYPSYEPTYLGRNRCHSPGVTADGAGIGIDGYEVSRGDNIGYDPTL